MIRRLSNISESLPDSVRVKVIDKFTCQMKNSGYSRMDIVEVVISGIRGFRRKMQGRAFTGLARVPSARESRRNSWRRLAGTKTRNRLT